MNPGLGLGGEQFNNPTGSIAGTTLGGDLGHIGGGGDSLFGNDFVDRSMGDGSSFA